MSAAAPQQPHVTQVVYQCPPEVICEYPKPVEIPPPAPWLGLRVPMSRDDFENRDWNEGAAAGWKFEWSGGFAEAFEERMKLSEIKYMQRLPHAFSVCPHAKDAEMFYEVECWLDELDIMRKPDFCVFTRQQIAQADAGGHPVPRFVIEVLSPRDQIHHIHKKLGEYFAAGVKTVWHVNPEVEIVGVYTSPTDVEVKHGDDVCSAAPAFSKFKMKARDIFAAAKS